MSYESVLVTGANRGIGLEFVKQLVKSETPPKHVFATYRSKDTVQALEEIRDASDKCQVILIQADITKKDDVKSIRKSIEDVVGDIGLTLLINNAGVLKHGKFSEVNQDDLLYHFNNNVVGPVTVLQEMLPLLQKAAASKDTEMSSSRAAVLNISSVIGSIGEIPNHPPMRMGAYGYRTSKAALNMAMRLASVSLKEHGILLVNMCPGWVKTDMGTQHALIEVTDSVSSMLKTLPTLGESQQGLFFDRDGNVIAF